MEEIKKELVEIKTELKKLRNELKGLIEIQQQLVHERLGVPLPPPPSTEESKGTSGGTFGLEISNFGDKRIKITGKNTFNVKDHIKEVGQASFEKETKSWSLPSDCLENLIKKFESIKLVRGVDFSVTATMPVINTVEEEDKFDSGSGPE